ncbi:hypothetical protein B0G77_4226 [Paraburkholderia sp. BL10I2N1]|nr:hypothetical protein B0G77_4226 [Paraburkholderia sp. BL10I2N1]
MATLEPIRTHLAKSAHSANAAAANAGAWRSGSHR